MSKGEDSSRATCGSLSDGDLSDSCGGKEHDAKGAEPVGEAQKQKAKKKQRQRQRQEKDEAFRNMLAKQGAVGGNGAVETPGAEDMVGLGGQEIESTNHHKKLSKNEILQQEKQRKERNRAMQEERERKKQEEEAARLKTVPAAKDSCNRIEKSSQDGGPQQNHSCESEQVHENAAPGNNGQANANTPLRSPIVCILGHLHTGKTKMFNRISREDEQDFEMPGNHQQISTGFLSKRTLQERLQTIWKETQVDCNIPGLLLIDTPGHKNFSNLRARGASYCDLAVVVVDIMHGLESETIESIKLLRKHRIPFLVALNKIDRLYGWESHPSMTVKETIEMQSEAVKIEYQKLFESTILQLQEQGLNASVFFENRNNRTVVNVVPTSGLSGDGIVDLLYLLFSLSEKMLINKIKYQDEVECKVLDVRTIDGSRTVLDAIVVNGRLKEKQKILVGGLDGPIITHVRSLLTTIAPRDSRSKLNYAQNAEVKGTISVKICANGIERAAAGSRLYIINDEREETALKEKVMKDLDPFISKFRRGGDGVHIQAMSFGSLEALFDFLDGANNHPIPVSGVGIGPVSKYNVKKTSIILEREKENAKACDKEYAKLGRWVSGNPFSSFNEAYACILAYEAPVLPDAEKAAKELGIPIVRSDALLQLVESVNARVTEVKQKKQTMADQMLMDACTHGTPEAIEFLLKNGANVNTCNQKGDSALHAAASSSSSDALKLLVKNGANIRAVNSKGENPLHIAARSGDISSAKSLLRAKAQVREVCSEGKTALHEACLHGTPELVNLLIEHKANVNAASGSGMSCFECALRRKNLNMIDQLTDNGLDLNLVAKAAEGRGGKWTALHIAAECGSIKLCKAVIKRGLRFQDPEAKNAKNQTAADVARSNPSCSEELVNYLEDQLPQKRRSRSNNAN